MFYFVLSCLVLCEHPIQMATAIEFQWAMCARVYLFIHFSFMCANSSMILNNSICLREHMEYAKQNVREKLRAHFYATTMPRLYCCNLSFNHDYDCFVFFWISLKIVFWLDHKQWRTQLVLGETVTFIHTHIQSCVDLYGVSLFPVACVLCMITSH